MSKKPTIKNDPFADPFGLVIPEGTQEERSESPRDLHAIENSKRPMSKPASSKKEKLTVHLTHDLIERVKNAAYWNPRLTIAAIAERGIIQVIEEIEQEHGGPYPPREEELKGGRPIGSTKTPETR